MSEGFLTTLFGGQDSSSDDLGAANPPADDAGADAPASDESGSDVGGSHAGGAAGIQPMDDSAG